MPADKLRDLLTGLEKQLGAYHERGKSRLEQVQQYQVVFIPCTFEKAALEMKVVLDKERLVTGLFFVRRNRPLNGKPPLTPTRKRLAKRRLTS